MSDDRTPSTGQNARLLRALIWTGLGLAPVAAVVVMLSGGNAVRFAVVLIAVSVVLVGAAMLVRTDPVLGQMDVEDRVAEGAQALRSQIRAENAAASRAMLQQVQSLAEEVGRLRGAAAVRSTGRPESPASPSPDMARSDMARPDMARPAAAGSGSVSRAVPVGSGSSAVAPPRPVGEGTGGRASVAVAAGRIPAGGRASAPGWPETVEPRWGRPDVTPGWEDDDRLPLPGESSGTRGSIPLQRTGSLPPTGPGQRSLPLPPAGPGPRSGPLPPTGPGQRSGAHPAAGPGQRSGTPPPAGPGQRTRGRVPPASRPAVPPVPAAGRGGEYGAPRGVEGAAGVYGSSRPAGYGEASDGGSWSDPRPRADSDPKAWGDSAASGDSWRPGDSGPLGDGPLGDGPLGDGPLSDGPLGDGLRGDGLLGNGLPADGLAGDSGVLGDFGPLGDGLGWTDDEPDSGGWVADDPGFSERRWTDETVGSYRRDDGPEPRRPAVYGTPARPEPARPHKRRADVTAVDLGYTGRRTKPNHAGPDHNTPDHNTPDDAGPVHDSTDYDHQIHNSPDRTGPKPAGPDYTKLSEPDDDDGAYWRRIAADPGDW